MTDSSSSPKKIHIKTYGCQMNVYDTLRMQDVMAPEGYTVTDDPDEADLVVLNTCHIREKAEEKVYSDLGRVRQARERRKAEGKEMLIAVGGCVGQAEGEAVFDRAPYVDIVMGPQTYHRLPDMVARAKASQRVVDLDFEAVEKFDLLPEARTENGVSAFLSIQEGCDKFCTFCVVPYTRGAEFSRDVAPVLDEARRLAASGAMEITLLGQNVNAYHGTSEQGDWSLAKLIREIAKIPEIRRIRYTTSHPRDVTDDLIAVHGDEEKLMPYLHLPVQSGSDRILKAMNRKHTAAWYVDVVEKFRANRPDIAFSSDFIVGFPGETDADFEATLQLVRTVEFASAFSFKYSARPGTPAADSTDQIPESVKDERLAALQKLLGEQQLRFNRRSAGLTMPVLLTHAGRHPGQLLGKSPWMQSVYVEAPPSLVGRIVPISIVAGYANSLAGDLTPHQQGNYVG